MKVAITGTPGTGKTAIAKALGKKMKWRVIHLTTLAQTRDLYCGYDEQRKVKIVDVDRIQAVLAEVKGNVIFESHFAQDIDADLTVVLSCEIAELGKRMVEKGWKKPKRLENLQAEIFQICLEEAQEHNRLIFEVDTTHKTPEQAADDIAKVIRQYEQK